MADSFELKAGQLAAGFRLARKEPLPNLRATALLLEHVQSGARFLHVHNEDTENAFAVTFPTPPPDDTGVPHILEHGVLAGSRKYPVREPFFEMVKMSMATFINAMTGPACTTYPIATNVKKDFFNLAEVYLDAVFHPELAEATFLREGHHWTLADNADLASPLALSGVVYSEMRGAYSAPESLMWRAVNGGLYPETALGRDSGGNPDRIPDLTFEGFRRFHAVHYHPSNALIFAYGDIPTAEHLRLLAPVLDAFERGAAVAPPARQPRWAASRREEREYPVGAAEDTGARAFLSLNWLVGDALDPAEATAWEALDRMLLGDEAAPLKRALVDSRLGADLFLCGAWAAAHEQEFHVGLRGTEPERADAFERLVLDTLARVAADGLAAERVEAAFRQLAYEHLEIKTLFPLHALEAVNASWPYGGDPLTFLTMDRHLAECRRRYAAQGSLFVRMIRERLLANPHRLLVALRATPGLQARADEALARRLAERKAAMTRAEVAALARRAAEIEAEQAAPNPPEAVARLPQLGVGDLPRRPRHIPTQVGRVAGIELLHNDVLANGVNALEFDVDLAGLPSELYAFLPHFCDAVNKMGAGGENYAAIAERRAANTGGLWCGWRVCQHAANAGQPLRRLRLGLKTLDAQAGAALRLMGDLVFGVDPRDRERLRDVLAQSRAWYRSTLVNDGLGTARRQAARGLSPAAALDHLTMSREALRLIEKLAGEFDTWAEDLMRRIERIRDFLLARARWTASFTGSDGVFTLLERTLGEWSGRMRGEPVRDEPLPFEPCAAPPREGLAAALDTAFCVKAMPAPHLSDPAAPLFRAGAYLATFDYLLPQIRFKGNAYGAGAAYDDGLGTFHLYSFRDPRIAETLAVFDGFRAFAQGASWTQTDVDRGIIGCARDAERPIRPGEATASALTRHVRGDTNERRERRYEALLRATPGTVQEALLGVLDRHEPAAAVCVVSSRERLAEANRALGARGLSVADILT